MFDNHNKHYAIFLGAMLYGWLHLQKCI